MTLDQYYERNIDVLCNFCDKYNIPQDYVSDTYIKVKRVLDTLNYYRAARK